MCEKPILAPERTGVPKILTQQSKLNGLSQIPMCQRPQQSQRGMDTLIMGAVNQDAQFSPSWQQAACSWCIWLQMTSSDATDLQFSKWTRFSTAATVTIGTLTMALTCLLYWVSAICWGSFKWPVLQEAVATLSSTCIAHLITVFDTLRLLQMGALIGPVHKCFSLG